VARRVVQWLADQPSAPRPLLSSFSLAALQAARAALDALQADVPLAYLVETYDDGALEQAVALGAEGLHTDWQQVTPAVAAAVHARGLKLRAYTVNDADQARALLADGLDGLFTDRLDLPSRL